MGARRSQVGIAAEVNSVRPEYFRPVSLGPGTELSNCAELARVLRIKPGIATVTCHGLEKRARLRAPSRAEAPPGTPFLDDTTVELARMSTHMRDPAIHFGTLLAKP